MRNVSDECCTENQNTFCVQQIFFENRAIYEKTWKNVVERGKPQMTIWRTRIACWIPKATSTHSQYVILIAVPLQTWLHESALMLRYTYIAWLVVPDSVCTVQYGLNLTTSLFDFLLFFRGVVVAQAISHKHLTPEATVRSQVSQCKICGEHSVNGTGYIPSPTVAPCQYHSTNVQYSFSSTRSSYRDKWAKTGNLNIDLSEI
jgi:hypothetical protein